MEPGGGNDIVGRLYASRLSDKLGKQVIVENRAGAGGTIGTELAARSKPDGYTLLLIPRRPCNVLRALQRVAVRSDEVFRFRSRNWDSA